MPDREKVIKGLECCMKWTGEPNTATCHCSDCSYTNMDVFGERCLIDLINDALVLLKEQGKLVDVDALREKLGLAKDCAKCKQNTRACQYDSHFSLMDFCERFDMAIEELMQEGR